MKRSALVFVMGLVASPVHAQAEARAVGAKLVESGRNLARYETLRGYK